MEAADESRRRGGRPVLLEDVLQKARRAAGDRPRQEKRVENPRE